MQYQTLTVAKARRGFENIFTTILAGLLGIVLSKNPCGPQARLPGCRYSEKTALHIGALSPPRSAVLEQANERPVYRLAAHFPHVIDEHNDIPCGLRIRSIESRDCGGERRAGACRRAGTTRPSVAHLSTMIWQWLACSMGREAALSYLLSLNNKYRPTPVARRDSDKPLARGCPCLFKSYGIDHITAV